MENVSKSQMPANSTKHRRLFTFGCSFTMYAWPTYADILGDHFEVYENWAFPGLGNRAIAERVAECHAKNKFTKDDVVIVQWSTHIRNDYHTFVPMQFDTKSFLHVWFRKNNQIGWKTQGSIFNPNNRQFVYNDKWVNTFWDEHSYLMYSLNDMSLTQGLLDSTQCTWYMTSIGDFAKMCTDIPNAHDENISDQDNIYNSKPELEIYKSVLEHPNWLEPIGTYSWKHQNDSYEFDGDNGKWLEVHPSHKQHFNYADQIVNLDIDLTEYKNKISNTIEDIKLNESNFLTFQEEVSKAVKHEPMYRGF
jgi:hypothetical protein